MGLIVKPNATTNGTTADGTEVSQNFDTIYAEFNGNIDNNNIKAAAGIVDTKLAQITTASKVSTSALTGTISNASIATISASNKVYGSALAFLANIASTAGIIPVVNLPGIRSKMGTFVLDMTNTGTSASYTGVGFTPTLVTFIANVSNSSNAGCCIGFGSTASNFALINGHNQSAEYWEILTAYCVSVIPSLNDRYSFSIASADSDGFTITKGRTNTPTGSMFVCYIATR